MQVSRCGMIYMEPSSMGWKPIFRSWVNLLPQTLTEFHRSIIIDLFDRFVDACIRTVRKAIEVSEKALGKAVTTAICVVGSLLFR